MPVHLRAVDGVVLRRAGKGTPSLVDAGLSLAANHQLGAARQFLAAARSAWITNSPTLNEAVDALAAQPSETKTSSRIAGWLAANVEDSPTRASTTFAEVIIRSGPRTKALDLLQRSRNPLVGELLRSRALTNTVLFPPSASASGQAFDAAVAIAGLLAEDGRFSVGLNNALLMLTLHANRGEKSQSFEQALMDLMSLAQRFDWGALGVLVAPLQDPETLRLLAARIRQGEGVPVIYAATCLTGNAAGVANYLTTFSKTGLDDLRLSLQYGAGGVNRLLTRHLRLCDTGFCRRFDAGSSGLLAPIGLSFVLGQPTLALATKWLLYLLGGFFVAASFHYARRVPELEKPLEVRGIHLAREFLFALGFLLVVLLLSEPFLSQGGQKVELPFRLHLPMVGGAAPAGTSAVQKTVMNPGILLTLLLFFVLQGLIYIVCLVKLAEIRRQRVPPRIKLKLLENEDHLFDAGLYLGFVGTIVSLILVSLNVIHFSLMAAYSSTCFGIVFVVIFKIFHLRPTRRKLLLAAEAESPDAAAPTAHAYAAPV